MTLELGMADQNDLSKDPWVQKIVKISIKTAKEQAGPGWSLLAAPLRKALVARVALASIGSLDTDFVSSNTALRVIALATAINQLEL